MTADLFWFLACSEIHSRNLGGVLLHRFLLK